jgi:hypothetical protein
VAEGILSRLRRTFGGAHVSDDAATSEKAELTNLSTEAFRQIFSAAKALAHYHNVDRTSGDIFHINLGHGLSQRYHEEERTELEYAVIETALNLFCHPLALYQFEAGTAACKPVPAAERSGLGQQSALPIIPLIDFYEVGCDQRKMAGMKREWCPFVGAAAELWEAGIDNLEETHPKVLRARELVLALATRPSSR